MKKTLHLFFAGIFCIFSAGAQLIESFDGAGFPPVGWTNTHTTGTNPAALWERATAGALGGDIVPGPPPVTYTVDPHSGAGMASFRSYDFARGEGAHLVTGAVNLTAGGPHLISFWFYRENLYFSTDSISVYINTTASATGALFLGKVLRKRSYPPVETRPDGWFRYSFNIPSGYNTATNYFIFSAVGDFGNNMFIDDIAVAAQPTCNPPTAITTSNFNQAGGTITANWTAPSSGSTTGYEWAVNTTGSIPASGTGIAGTTANIAGITAGAQNFIFVRTNCGGGNFSDWAYTSLAALDCVTLIGPAAGATNQSQGPVFSWNSMTGATSYNFYLGNGPGNLILIGGTAGTSATLPPGMGLLLPLQNYYWNVVPVINGSAAPGTGCAAISFTTGPEIPIPANNPCAGAINISAANIAANPVNATTADATISLPASPCLGINGGTPDDDVWFEFTTSAIPPTGTLTFTPAATGGIFDIVAQVYAANSCTNLGAPVTCVDETVDNAPEVLNLNLLSPNTHYFMRVYSWLGDTDDRGAFTIVASAGNTLPVSLATFTARRLNGVNILNWSTQQEINSSHFEIERSNDGIHFTSIGQVAAAGNSNTVTHYSFTDIDPASGNNYYRLRTVDKDNAVALSDIRTVRNAGMADVHMYPNPVREQLTVAINSDKATKGNLVITDLSGRAVYTRSLQLPPGNTILPVTVSGIAAGTYIMKIQLNDDLIVKKFSKQ